MTKPNHKQLKVKVTSVMNDAVTEMAGDLGVSRGTIVRDAVSIHTRTPNTLRGRPFSEARQGVCPANASPNGAKTEGAK